MEMCPHCGSTAQVKKLSEEYVKNWDSSQINLITNYQCGCGTKFRHVISYVEVAESIFEENQR